MQPLLGRGLHLWGALMGLNLPQRLCPCVVCICNGFHICCYLQVQKYEELSDWQNTFCIYSVLPSAERQMNYIVSSGNKSCNIKSHPPGRCGSQVGWFICMERILLNPWMGKKGRYPRPIVQQASRCRSSALSIQRPIAQPLSGRIARGHSLYRADCRKPNPAAAASRA